MNIFEFFFGKKVKCPNCGHSWRYNSPWSTNDYMDVCEKCKRGIYSESNRFFNRFPIKPNKDNWVIMPLCSVCGNPATHYDEKARAFRDTTRPECYLS